MVLDECSPQLTEMEKKSSRPAALTKDFLDVKKHTGQVLLDHLKVLMRCFRPQRSVSANETFPSFRCSSFVFCYV